MNLRKTIADYRPCCEQEQEDRRMLLRYLDQFDDILLRSNEIAHFTASSWIVNPNRTHALMAYHNIYKNWAWTGGHADGDSDLLAVAIREAQEETSVSLIKPVSELPYSLEILTVDGHFKRGKFVVPHLHLNLTYLLEADDRQSVHCKPDENSGVKWFPLSEVEDATSEPYMKIIYRKLNGKLR